MWPGRDVKNYYKVTAMVSGANGDGLAARVEFHTANGGYHTMIKASNGCDSKSTATFSWTLSRAARQDLHQPP